ncbi:hypothetical protein ABI_24880 [Asticcacaulis biprosthecium C19]|uniref:Uncharacterized protein n=1 Tax=Asticcacaulis biprosthecium C19 TaxID=715226 RepID=F4QP17_9CAUL|nr:hypothetical protein ABI_24880 [Asticcacaulis biprosthecium C19]
MIDRWDDLREQLDGIVVPQRMRDPEYRGIAEEFDRRAPNFSPQAI